jgi:SagB-type dehydrogenase family enzyme
MKKFGSASSHLVHWKDGELRIVNYVTGKGFSTNIRILEVLQFFMSPRTVREALLEFDAYSRESVGDAILRLIGAELLLEYESPEWRHDRLLLSWEPWLPGGAFHFLTKDATYVGRDWTDEKKAQTLPVTPPPPQFKTIEGVETVPLDLHPRANDTFFDTLYTRQTHRSFSNAALPLKDVEQLLHTTWGIQRVLDGKLFGELPGKTSPSGGARHPIEVYLMALRVNGLNPGIYHYQAKDHCLERVTAGADARTAQEYCADQPYFANAAALFIMTAVFTRTMWKYPHPRAYRIVLLDAGHLGQTFCLTATRMGLAPFCTAALKDSLIEKDLGIDGILESVLYVVGVGLPAET